MKNTDNNFISKEDANRHATVADVKRAAIIVREELNQVLFQFQQAMVQAEGRYIQSWNAVNSILKALLDKGLITEADVVLAGKAIYDEMKAYEAAKIEEARLQKEGVIPMSPVQSKPTPLENLTTATFKKGE